MFKKIKNALARLKQLEDKVAELGSQMGYLKMRHGRELESIDRLSNLKVGDRVYIYMSYSNGFLSMRDLLDTPFIEVPDRKTYKVLAIDNWRVKLDLSDIDLGKTWVHYSDIRKIA